MFSDRGFLFVQGEKVKGWNSSIQEGNTLVTSDLGELPEGVYHVLASPPDSRAFSPLVKIN